MSEREKILWAVPHAYMWLNLHRSWVYDISLKGTGQGELFRQKPS